MSHTGPSSTAASHCAPHGRPARAEMHRLRELIHQVAGWMIVRKKLANIEQQMSAECAPGMIAFSTAIAPPTGTVARPGPTDNRRA